MRIQSKEILICDDCKKEVKELYNYRRVVYYSKGIGVIAEAVKEICWDCMQDYIKQINQQNRELQEAASVKAEVRVNL